MRASKKPTVLILCGVLAAMLGFHPLAQAGDDPCQSEKDTLATVTSRYNTAPNQLLYADLQKADAALAACRDANKPPVPAPAPQPSPPEPEKPSEKKSSKKGDDAPPVLPGIGADPDKCGGKCDSEKGEECREIVKDVMTGERQYQCIAPKKATPSSSTPTPTPTPGGPTNDGYKKLAFLLGAEVQGGPLVSISGDGIGVRGTGGVLGRIGVTSGGSVDFLLGIGPNFYGITKGFVAAALQLNGELAIAPWKEKRVKVLVGINYLGTAGKGDPIPSKDPTCLDPFGRPKADPFGRCTMGNGLKWLQQYEAYAGVKGDLLVNDANTVRVQPKLTIGASGGDDNNGANIIAKGAVVILWNK